MAIKIGILGHAQSRYELDYDYAMDEMVFYTARNALANSRLEIGDIDTVIQAGDDVMDGIAINHVYTIEPAGAYLKEESKVEKDGAWAVQYAIARLLTGKFKTALVIGFSKSSQCSPSAFSGMIADPFYLRPIGVDNLTAAALQANTYMLEYGISEEEIARVAVRARLNGTDNPLALNAGNYSVDDVMNSKPLSTPIKELEAPPISDGVAAVVLVSEVYMQEKNLDLVTLTGFGYASHAYYPSYRNFAKLESAEVAARSAYKMSGLTPADINLAEIYAMYSHQEFMLSEAMGFCDFGEGVHFFKESSKEGKIPVNPSGGVLVGHPIYASGIIRIIEACKQLQGLAGNMQVKAANKALVHAQGGLAMQNNIVYTMES